MHRAGKSFEFPFAAVVGMRRVKEALGVLAVDPGLNGVLIASGPGTAKSLLGRAFPGLLPGVGPHCVELSLGVTEDRLLGGLDLQRTLLTGERHVSCGILARANRGVLYVDDINLLDRAWKFQVANALTTGTVRLEREGFSALFPSDFILVGTYDPEQGDLEGPLADLAGLHAREPEPLSREEQFELLQRIAAFDSDPERFLWQYEPEMALLRARIAGARCLLPGVTIDPQDSRRLVAASLRFGVEGHRADLFAVRAARAHAAFMGHAKVQEDDLQAAVRLVIIPRAATAPDNRVAVQLQRRTSQPIPGGTTGAEDVPVEPVECRVPETLVDPPREHVRQNAAAGRQRTHANTTSASRGRWVRAVAREPAAPKIAVEATLRAAAPFQMMRRQAAHRAAPALKLAGSDLRYKQFKQKPGILIIFVVDASGSMALNRMNQAKGALMQLLERAYVHRDKVALIAFRGNRADVLLPPSRSVELARRALKVLPAGGGTPLAAGLRAALDLARREQQTPIRRRLLVLFTDGRANVARGSGTAQIWNELQDVSEALRGERIASLVVDTGHAMVSSGQTERLAELLGGRHFRLPRCEARALLQIMAATAETVREVGA